MDNKRAVISFIFIIAFVIFSIGLTSADHCFALNGPCEDSGYHTIMHLSSLTNAHGELYNQYQYSDWNYCCTFGGTNNCESGNKIIGLSTPTNAHAEIPEKSSYLYNLCYSNLECASFSSSTNCADSNYEYFMFFLSQDSNAHIWATTGWDQPTTQPPAEYDTIICCRPGDAELSCGNGILEAGEQCDDGNKYNGDGCSYPGCYIELDCNCIVWEDPNCCYCTPTSHWYLNSNPTQLNPAPDYYGTRINDALTMRFDETFCMSPGTTRTFEIIEGTTTIATATATVGTTYTEATYGPIQQSFFNSLGAGHSQIYFRMFNPWYSNYENSYTIEVMPKFCGDGECSAVDKENCSSCPSDCGECCGNGVVDSWNGETCDDTNKVSGDGCSYPGCTTETPTTCSFTSKSWSVSSAVEGQTVQLTVLGNSNCNGRPITFQVLEYDLLATDDPVELNPSPLTVTMNGGVATTSWIAEWPGYGDDEQTPEYYFIASTGGVSQNDKNPRLSVSGDPCGNGVPDSGETCSNCEEDIGKCCGNGVIDSGEQCDNGNLNGRDCDYVLSGSIGTLACYPSGTANECKFNTVGCSIPGVCAINTASWNETVVNEGTPVKLNIFTNNCNDGEIISFVVKESDGLLNSDDDVDKNPLNVTISGNIAIGLWTSEWHEDTNGGQENPPEYYFIATMNGEETESSNQLIVNELIAGCTLINLCSDYDETQCNNDPCGVVKNSVGVTCGTVYNPLTRCADITDCGCIWDDSLGTCNSYWDLNSLCGTCGNGVEDFEEQCDDGNTASGDGCSYPGCQFENDILPPCPYGTTLCSDGTCSKNCYSGSTDTAIANCNYMNGCEAGEGCNCLDCYGDEDTCAEGLTCNIFNAACCNSASDGICDLECSYVDPDCAPAVCGNSYREVGEQCDDGNTDNNDGCCYDTSDSTCSGPCQLEILTSSCCVEGTAECEDGTCSLNCYATDGKIVQDGDNCCGELIFSPVDQACCNSISDGYCNPYCHYIDPDCIVIPPEGYDDGICTTTDSTTDNCDDGVLKRSLDALWIWAVGNNYPTNLTEDYWWDGECNGGVGCYRYDPIVDSVLNVRKHETCTNLQDEIMCPEQIKINLFGVYGLLAAIVLIIIIYLIFFSRKKKKSKTKKKK
jgi:cysteine-rich repeat protein